MSSNLRIHVSDMCPVRSECIKKTFKNTNYFKHYPLDRLSLSIAYVIKNQTFEDDKEDDTLNIYTLAQTLSIIWGPINCYVYILLTVQKCFIQGTMMLLYMRTRADSKALCLYIWLQCYSKCLTLMFVLHFEICFFFCFFSIWNICKQATISVE